MAQNNTKEVSGWTGWVFFAGFMMIVMGFLQTISGLTALLNSDWLLVAPQRLLFLNFTAWGWAHLLLGIVVLIAGFYVMHGSTWARIVGVILAAVGLIANLAYVNTYPIWSIAIMVIDVLVIYALIVHGNELKEQS